MGRNKSTISRELSRNTGGARGKTIVFGLLKRGYKVYTQIIEKCDRNTLQTIIRDLCINRNNHQKPTFHPLGDFLNPALALRQPSELITLSVDALSLIETFA
jgi:hypothetical protein